MNRGLVNIKEFRDNFSKADFRLGKSSYCFIVGDKIYKFYAKKYGNPITPTNECDLSIYKADTIVFPIEYIYDKKICCGEIQEYIKSSCIIESFNCDALVSRILESYDQVIGDLLLYPNIYMQDVSSVNILYSNELGFHIIDTMEWKIVSKDMYKVNLSNFNLGLIKEIFEYFSIPVIYGNVTNYIDQRILDNISKYGDAGKRLQDGIKNIIYRNYNFLKIMYGLIDSYRVYSKTDPKTLGDVKEFVKELKKG